jgi:hypothetical protein
MIQPSKLTISHILETNLDSLEQYFPDDPKDELRQAAKEKNILVMNRLSLSEEKQLFVRVQENVDLLKKCLLLRESQLGMVLYIEDNRSKLSKETFIQ